MKKFCLLALLILPLFAQAQLFRAGVAVGVNFAQIEGDNVGGYHKFGLNAGVVGDIILSENWEVGIEILYAQRGSRATTRDFPADFTIKMDYAEIPLLIRFRDLKGGIDFGAGVSLARLIRAEHLSSGVDTSEPFFDESNNPKSTDVSLLAEATYMFTPVIGLNLRVGYSLTPFRTDPASNFRNFGQYHHYITLRTIVKLSALFKKSTV